MLLGICFKREAKLIGISRLSILRFSLDVPKYDLFRHVSIATGTYLPPTSAFRTTCYKAKLQSLSVVVAGPGGVEEFENTVFALVEAIAQHPAIMLDHCALVIDLLLRALAALVSGGQGEAFEKCIQSFDEHESVWPSGFFVWASS